jgi:cytochrome c biogenesis protein CcdA
VLEVLATLTEQWVQAVQAGVWLAPLAALAAGLLTAANPCVLAMVPLMVAFVSGQERRSVAHAFLLSLVFSLGLTISLILAFFGLRMAAGLIPTHWWSYVAAAVCLLMGLHLVGILTWQLPTVVNVQPRYRGFGGALLLGMLFALVSTPCAGPVLLALLALANTGTSALYGLTLLVLYSIGHCALILVGGTSMGLVQRLADSKGWNRGIDTMRRAAGVVITLTGLYALFFF